MSENRTIKVILFSDVVDSSGRMFSDEARTIQLIERDLASFGAGISNWGGELIKNTGDGILATFSTSSQALDFIKEFLVNLSKESSPALQHRFGLHIGEVYHKNDDIIGQGVHLATRLQTISPVNGVAFTQGTHANIDPRFRSLVTPLGNIRLKGVPEEIVCFGITEEAFLGRPAKTQPEETQSTFAAAPQNEEGQASDSERIRNFISSQRTLITEQPSRAAAAFSDYIQDRHHLLVGARDILSRPEWREVLKSDDPKGVQVQLTRTRLTDWIQTNFSEATARPWVEALGGELKPAKGPTLETAQPPTAQATPSKPWLWIGLGGAAFTVLLVLAAVLLRGAGPGSVPNVPDGKGVSSGSSRDVDIDRPLPGESADAPALGSGALPETVKSNLGLTDGSGSGVDNGSDTGTSSGDQPSSGTSDSPAASTPSDLWDRVRSGLENGEITTSDLALEQAQAVVDHWVQDFNKRGTSLVIRLRTRQAVTAELCEPVLVAYQRAYRQSAIKPWVVLESSRSNGIDSVPGFLPVCQLSPQGQLSVGRSE